MENIANPDNIDQSVQTYTDGSLETLLLNGCSCSSSDINLFSTVERIKFTDEEIKINSKPRKGCPYEMKTYKDVTIDRRGTRNKVKFNREVESNLREIQIIDEEVRNIIHCLVNYYLSDIDRIDICIRVEYINNIISRKIADINFKFLKVNGIPEELTTRITRNEWLNLRTEIRGAWERDEIEQKTAVDVAKFIGGEMSAFADDVSDIASTAASDIGHNLGWLLTFGYYKG